MDVFRQACLRPDTGEWTDAATFADNGVFYDAIGQDGDAVIDIGIPDDAVGADNDIAADTDTAFNDDVDIDGDVSPHFQAAAQVEAFGVHQGDAFSHEEIGLHQLIVAFQLGQLCTAVHAHDLVDGFRTGGGDDDTFVHRHLDHVSEIVFTLDIIILQPSQPGFKPVGLDRHHPGIDFANGTFIGSGILVLDNTLDMSGRVADDASVSRGILKL